MCFGSFFQNAGSQLCFRFSNWQQSFSLSLTAIITITDSSLFHYHWQPSSLSLTAVFTISDSSLFHYQWQQSSLSLTAIFHYHWQQSSRSLKRVFNSITNSSFTITDSSLSLLVTAVFTITDDSLFSVSVTTAFTITATDSSLRCHWQYSFTITDSSLHYDCQQSSLPLTAVFIIGDSNRFLIPDTLSVLMSVCITKLDNLIVWDELWCQLRAKRRGRKFGPWGQTEPRRTAVAWSVLSALFCPLPRRRRHFPVT